MKSPVPPLIAALSFVVASMPVSVAAPTPLVINLDLAAAGTPISPDLFGIFFEDLNYAADGGLYAELVQNRSFEYQSTEQRDWNEFTGWSTVAYGDAAGGVSVRSAKPIHPHNPHYISVEVKKPGAGYGVANAGVDGIPLQAHATYELSFFAHQLFMGEPWSPENDIVGRPMPVTLRLESPSGEVLAEATQSVSGRDWHRYTVRLVPGRAEAKARVALLGNARGGFALDEISLFPENTFHRRKNGLRADLAQAIADLHPKFVRFPGGCLAHGDGVNNFYRWKDTIGPVELRRGQRNLWGYHQSVGLGYFEYFQFCEDIGAKPLPVLPAGVSCQNSNYSPGHGQQCLPIEDMAAYIQDILDLIEWANAPATSQWGAVRAAAGHPAPFGLKYVGIGNEDRITPEFEARFKMIQDAIRAKHPEIVVIGTVGPFPDGEDFERGWTFARAENVAMVDEHYYRPPDWFWENLHRYDRYGRPGPKVYVGEYAAHDRDRRNTLHSALAEAAGCIGFERNGDVVALSSYAPLLARRGHTQWTPDMIYFTATEVFPSINYQVQRLFATNSGDTLLPVSIEGSQPPEHLAISAVRDSASGNAILKVVNGDASARSATINFTGSVTGRSIVTTVLTADNPDAANQDEQPSTCVPTESKSNASATLSPTFPANSLTIIRLQ
ncbi:MAG TPA: alpha-L-arabinofuranosidase C-terminal domain-containing protein [Candidatus Didemnitutus sp.]|nr:alpha-L-arabinofuranosidase C-terminal domain-containing protein [Candidatus Didemnitutus sp.]